MFFNPDPYKPAPEAIFSRKVNKIYHRRLLFNNSTVKQISSQKNFVIHLHEELTLKHINEKVNKANKGIKIIRKLNNMLPHRPLLTIYPSFVRPHLDDDGVIFDQPKNELFRLKIESV